MAFSVAPKYYCCAVPSDINPIQNQSNHIPAKMILNRPSITPKLPAKPNRTFSQPTALLRHKPKEI